MPLPLLSALSALFGLCIGSFLNVCIHRIPIGQTPWNPPRSYCPACKKPVRPLHNIPIMSYLLLRGRCAGCSERIPIRYPLVELSAAALFAWSFWRFGWTLDAARGALLGSLLLALGVIDWRTGRLPNALTGAGALSALCAAAIESAASAGWEPLWGALLGGAAGAAVLWTARILGSLAFRQEALGFGDVKLIGMTGLFLGDWGLALLTVAFSAFIGCAVETPRLLWREKRRIPYGAYLAIAGWVCLIWGDLILGWYLSLFRS